MKKCPFCAEEIQDEAKKCKYCGELIDEKASKIKDAFSRYEQWLKQNYPMYQVVTKNSEGKTIVLNKTYKSFNPIAFIILLLLWVLPGLIYALVTSGKKILSLTLYFDDDGSVKSISKSNFKFLQDKYNQSQNF